MSCRLAVAKDRRGWHACGPWSYAHDVPRGYFGETTRRCRRRYSVHQHIYFSSWGHAMLAARLFLPSSTLNLQVRVEG